MMKVPNKAIINKIAIKSFKVNKTRNMFAIIAILLTTVLFTTLFTIGIGIIETAQTETMRQAGGMAHASLKYISEEQFNKLKRHPLIKEIGENIMVAVADNKELTKRRTEIWYSDKTGAKLGFTTPTSGKLPQKENEISLDTITMDLLGLKHDIGEKVTIKYKIKGKSYEKQFIVTGYYKGDPAFSAGMILVSHSFIESKLKDILPNYNVDYDATGTIRADIMFKSSIGIEKNIQKVITDSGYSIDEKNSNFVRYGVNWAYLSTNSSADPVTIIGVILAAILIIFTGYLIIYNIFQISVIKDIKFYGLLKTIGTTSRQIKQIIRRQALLLSAIGIPFGLVFGYILGKNLLPMVVEVSSFSGRAEVSLNPLIFLIAALFSLLTVFIGYRKPGKIASVVSPVEAVRYSGVSVNSKKVKKSTDGGKLCKMAFSNLGRNKKRTIIVIASMSLSLILLNTIFTISQGFDINKFVGKFAQSDFLIANAKYMKSEFSSPADSVSQSLIDAASRQRGFIDGGKIYYEYGSFQNKRRTSDAQIYGLEDFPAKKLDIVDGKFDLDKFKTGKYILEGLQADDNGKIIYERSYTKVGEKVKIKIDRTIHEYEVMARCLIRNNNYCRFFSSSQNKDGSFSDDPSVYLSAKEFCKIEKDKPVMNYQYDMESKYTASMETFLKGYTKSIEPTMNYESKMKYINSFHQFRDMLLTVGGILSLIVGIIGILNFINSMLTSIIARRQELAMLQSIGMTDNQLHKMLVFEGAFYAVATILVSLVLSILFSIGIVGGIVSSLWFFSYKFVITPLLYSYPILIILSTIIPFAACFGVNKQSIVERLKEAE